MLVAYVEAKPRGFGFDDEENDVPFVVDIAGQLGQKRVEHGDEESGQQVLPKQVVAAGLSAALLPGIRRVILPLQTQGLTSFRHFVSRLCQSQYSKSRGCSGRGYRL